MEKRIESLCNEHDREQGGFRFDRAIDRSSVSSKRSFGSNEIQIEPPRDQRGATERAGGDCPRIRSHLRLPEHWLGRATETDYAARSQDRRTFDPWPTIADPN